MAILDTLPGVEVSILTNGQTVEEYVDADEVVDGPLASKTVVKYIEAISDAEFTVKRTVLDSFRLHKQKVDDLLFQVKLDGKWAAGSFWENANLFAPDIYQIAGFYNRDATGRSTINHFKFAEVEIVEVADKAKIDQDVKDAAALGQITVDVFRVKVGADTNFRPSLPRQTVSEIAEKAVKGRALSHGTAFGDTKIVPQRRTVDCDYLDGRDKPLARFVFRYRSKDALRQLLLIPRSPSPDPWDALPAAERERLGREAFQQQQGPKPEPRIKQERKVKRERRVSDIVDLTSDAPTAKQRKTTMQTPIDLTED
ncbi:hypothetical protein V498_05436 [Pseudogymnoascus sp. VKM F-4517 (FW-2822)]|nr:hypothetical protein V498_05436 [Pseudogymnoascus sp. VKM F-4517 (FW-2822)]